MEFILSILLFLGIISVLILIHELGHFWAAKKAGVNVEEFGLGFPPRIFSKKIGETVYSINALLLGGFVKLYGEDESVGKNKERSFYHKSKLARVFITIAGVMMNFLLGFLAFAVLYWAIGIPVRSESAVFVTQIEQGSPAENSGLAPLDRIIAVEGQKISGGNELKNTLESFAGQEVAIEYTRPTFLLIGVYQDANLSLNIADIVLRENPPEGQGVLGVGFVEDQVRITEDYPAYEMPFRALVVGTVDGVKFSGLIVSGIANMVGNLFTRGEVPEDVTGPVGIFQITTEVAKLGALPLLSLIGLLSVNLAVLNILPFPALDGGRLMFIVVEAIFGRKVLPAVEKYAHFVGFVLLITLIILISFRDVFRIVEGSSVLP